MELLLTIIETIVCVAILAVLFCLVLDSTKIIDEINKHGRYDHCD